MVDTQDLNRPEYDTLAERYSRCRTGYSEAAVQAIAAAIPGPGPVLDTATGTGILAHQLAPHVARLVGCDLSPAMARAARIPVAQALAENLLFAAGAFAAVTCAQAFHWFDAARAAAEMRRVVRPGGVIAILYKYAHPDEPLEPLADRLIEEFTGRPQARWDPPVPVELGALAAHEYTWAAEWTVAAYLGWMSSRESIRQRLDRQLPAFLGRLEERLVAARPEKGVSRAAGRAPLPGPPVTRLSRRTGS